MGIKKQTGFTIVELLIVIVVIGILAAITIVAFNGIQARANNAARVNEAKQWEGILTSYATTYGKYPDVLNTSMCLGSGFPDVNSDGVGDCWDIHVGGSNRYSMNTMLNTELKKVVSSLPNSTRKPVAGAGTTSRIGPAVTVQTGVVKIVYWLEGTDPCPIGTLSWNDTVSRACWITLPPAG
jgi:prepilin-type N-terminal cleavage/methylation domain-containing protein